ncbi:MAG: hypothetical protein HC915_18490 [Anaerolineae bacterium]|nr:hypothetical protein [Anaerolineae bacterium]
MHFSELGMRRRDGAPWYAELVLTRFEDIHGLRVVGDVYDITARREVERALKEAVEHERELNTLKTRFVSMVSHEFKTPLAAILMMVGVMERYGERLTLEKRADKLRGIEAQVAHMNQLLEDVLTLARTEAGTLPFTPEADGTTRFCRAQPG